MERLIFGWVTFFGLTMPSIVVHECCGDPTAVAMTLAFTAGVFGLGIYGTARWGSDLVRVLGE